MCERLVSSAGGRVPSATRTTDDFVIRHASRADLPEMARIHVRMLPVGLFPALGERFVRRWHRTYLDCRFGVALVAGDVTDPSGEIAGFLVGSTDHAGYMSALVAHRRQLSRLALAGAVGMLRRPRLIGRFLRTRARTWLPRALLGRGASWYPRAATPGRPVEAPALLDAVAVRSELRRRGVATQLIDRFLVEAAEGGARLAELVTDTNSSGATALYEHLGWTPVGDYVSWDGGTVRVYRYRLPGPGPGPHPDPGPGRGPGQ